LFSHLLNCLQRRKIFIGDGLDFEIAAPRFRAQGACTD